LNVCKNVGLDPFQKQIWCYKDYQQNLIIFAGRDGFLAIAQRDAQFDSLNSFEVCENDEFSLSVDGDSISVSHKIKSLSSDIRGQITGAYAIVKRKNGSPTIVFADIEQYDKNRSAWKTHKSSMIKKVAEMHALKKAFGISGLQIQEEWQIDNEVVTPNRTEIATDTYIATILELADQYAGAEELSDLEELFRGEVPTWKADEIYHGLRAREPKDIPDEFNHGSSIISELPDKSEKDLAEVADIEEKRQSALMELESASTSEELQEVWEKNKDIQGDNLFQREFNKKKLGL
jgi:recombinational DNA repair protein RecT